MIRLIAAVTSIGSEIFSFWLLHRLSVVDLTASFIIVYIISIIVNLGVIIINVMSVAHVITKVILRILT